MRNIQILFCLVFFASFGCKKDNVNYGEPLKPILLDTAFLYSQASTCVTAVNIFTPNGDGINDLFNVTAIGVDSFNLKIFQDSSAILFNIDNPGYYWDGTQDGSGLGSIREGFYTYQLEFKSSTGDKIKVSRKIYICKDVENSCFSDDVPIRCGDMFDPGVCSFIYYSAEIFCIK